MDEGNCVYFGPWNPEAQQLLGKYLPASHLVAAAGAAEQPRDAKKKPEKKEEGKKAAQVGPGPWALGGAGGGWPRGRGGGRPHLHTTTSAPERWLWLAQCGWPAQASCPCCLVAHPALTPPPPARLPPPLQADTGSKNKVHSASVPLKKAIW